MAHCYELTGAFDRVDAESIAAALPRVGRTLIADIDDEGAVIT